MIFMGVLFPWEREDEILRLSNGGLSNAANTFQWNVIEGLKQNLNDGVHVINAIPVGVWPNQYRQLVLKDRKWSYEGKDCFEVGAINLPFVKQFARTRKAKRILKKLIRKNGENEIILYSSYMPFLSALRRLPKHVKTTVIIADLPGVYANASRSLIKRILQYAQNRSVYKSLERVDRFVLLTEQMKEPLRIGDRPYTVVEGICDRKCDLEEHFALGEPQEKIILYTGTLHRVFGMGVLLDAFSAISAPEYRLWICGDGDMRNEILERSKTDNRISYFGYLPQKEICELRRKATILVNPRQNTGEYTKYSFPSKTMEYMTSGKPVVMYKLDGIPDEYDDYLCYVEDNDVDSLKEKIIEVCDLPLEDRVDLGVRAKKFVTLQKNYLNQVDRILKMIGL